MTKLQPSAADAPPSRHASADPTLDAPEPGALPPDRPEDEDDDACDIFVALESRYRARELRPGVIMFVPWNVYMPDDPTTLASLEKSPREDGRNEIERFADLVENIHAIVRGETLEGCQALVENWWVMEPLFDSETRFLKGVLTRHPILRTPAPNFRSSALIAISAEERWALTMNHFYELGAPR